jgi:hypothetical protein
MNLIKQNIVYRIEKENPITIETFIEMVLRRYSDVISHALLQSSPMQN